MQLAYRATRKNQPDKRDTLVSSPEQARKLIAGLTQKLSGKLSAHERATFLCAKAVLFEAIGDKEMLPAAQSAYKFSKTAQSCALVAVALHHFGHISEALEWYERSYKYPHESGFEIDIGYTNALLFQPDKWQKAWPIIKTLKKRMVFAAYLPFWDGSPVEHLQVISEGGFGDIIQNSRFLPLLKERGVKKVTVFLPDFFFQHGFVDLARRQSWWPEIKVLTEAVAGVQSAGFFDLPAVFNITPETLPPPPVWEAESFQDSLFAYELCGPSSKPKVGFCHAARAMETPLVASGVYRDLTTEQAERIVSETDVNWVNLQHNPTNNLGIYTPEIKSWMNTAAIIANLDAVVTVDTAVAHLAASMGKPTFVILSGAVDWKFGLQGDTCLWYKNIRLFRNNDFGFENSVNAVIKAIQGEEWEIQQSEYQI